eukprot:scaffold121633_cov21-Tisochrysis_lutea.AAC.2
MTVPNATLHATSDAFSQATFDDCNLECVSRHSNANTLVVCSGATCMMNGTRLVASKPGNALKVTFGWFCCVGSKAEIKGMFKGGAGLFEGGAVSQAWTRKGGAWASVQGGHVICSRHSLIQGGVFVTSGGPAAQPAPQIDASRAQWHRSKGEQLKEI